MGFRYAIVIQNDGLDVVETTKSFEKYGIVEEVKKDEEWTAFVILFSLGDWFRLKMDMKNEGIELTADPIQKGVYYPVAG